MKKETRKRIRKILLIALGFFLLMRTVSNALFGGLPGKDAEDKHLHTSVSPSGTRSVDVYLHYGSATVCNSVHCYMYGDGLRERAFFRLYHGWDADITWLDENRIFIDAETCGNEMYWKDVLPEGQDGIVLDLRGEWYDNGDFGGFGRDENGKVFLHKWWQD